MKTMEQIRQRDESIERGKKAAEEFYNMFRQNTTPAQRADYYKQRRADMGVNSQDFAHWSKQWRKAEAEVVPAVGERALNILAEREETPALL